jgi:exosortase F-associated protein
MTERKLSQPSRVVLIATSIVGLAMVYVFQRVNYFYFFCPDCTSGTIAFIFNRATRLLLNDLLCIVLIYAIFEKSKYVKAATVILLIELCVMLPLYLWIKLSVEGDSEISSPLLSQIHRLIVNPMLMFVLMAGFYYQKYFSSNRQ